MASHHNDEMPTPGDLVDRLKDVYGARTNEELARKLDIPLRAVSGMRAGQSPRWDRLIDLLHRAGWLCVDGDATEARAELARREALLGRLEDLLSDYLPERETQP